jgi:hypothetical protein
LWKRDERDELEAAKAAEAARNQAINANATEAPGLPAGGSTKVFSRAEIARMSTADYSKYEAEIKRQQSLGLIK